ncbi:CBS domain-containing protein [Marinilactibacillus kalidii]|uniref:CBS domain-containing protein n=1 Tax=Marinilactibacillus kalidii TaxID=2820274 RepID=UPI001ABEC4B6|nr:CBS domain-containing protein [Marinilactibacillus kalidii]
MAEDNVREFIHVFNELQKVVAKKIGSDPDTNFGSLLYEAEGKQDKVVINYKRKLDLYREFRNLLVHSTINEHESIANPSPSLIEEMRVVMKKIQYPKTVSDLFLEKVITFKKEDPFSKVLKAIEENQYSQFPVFQGEKMVGIISENGITNFLARSIQDDLITISQTTVADILENDEEKHAYEIIPKDMSIFEIESIYSKKIKEGIVAYFLLITNQEQVKHPDDLIGIITPWDMPEIIENK